MQLEEPKAWAAEALGTRDFHPGDVVVPKSRVELHLGDVQPVVLEDRVVVRCEYWPIAERVASVGAWALSSGWARNLREEVLVDGINLLGHPLLELTGTLYEALEVGLEGTCDSNFIGRGRCRCA